MFIVVYLLLSHTYVCMQNCMRFDDDKCLAGCVPRYDRSTGCLQAKSKSNKAVIRRFLEAMMQQTIDGLQWSWQATKRVGNGMASRFRNSRQVIHSVAERLLYTKLNGTCR